MALVFLSCITVLYFIFDGEAFIVYSFVTFIILLMYNFYINMDFGKVASEFEKGKQQGVKNSSNGGSRKETKGDFEREGGLPGYPSKELSPQQITNKNLRQKAADRQKAGWKIAEIDNKNKRVVMYSSKGGGVGRHSVVALFTGLWTFGAGNYAYEKATRRRNREKIVLRPDEVSSNTTASTEDSEVAKESKSSETEKLRELKELRDDDIITSEEFQEKKSELLKRI
ncbi:SHOCT domain-containing protein [Natronosalvus vescus]|uniref:SHOCT domain-containing protein n=1 Tax=Natronosalvus vescus TaxID=2953881 RepID=UPI002091C3EF|nr:SHOCT domain-containing protein [Natronosalvus vescus]